MRAVSESDVLDCKACGACCTSPGNDAYVPVTALDRRRMPTKYQKKLQDVIEPEDEKVFGLGVKRFADRFACTALKGTLGKDVGCDMYSQRPDYCRAFMVGSDECLERRREVFFVRPAIVGDE